MQYSFASPAKLEKTESINPAKVKVKAAFVFILVILVTMKVKVKAAFVLSW